MIATLLEVRDRPVVRVKVVLLCPAGIVILSGTLTASLVLCRVTTAPPEGAGPVRIAVAITAAFPCDALAASERPASTAGCTDTPAIAEQPPPDAEIVAEVLCVTGSVETRKAAEVSPAATIACAFTCAFGLLLLSSTVKPPAGAGSVRLTTPPATPPPTTAPAESPTEETHASTIPAASRNPTHSRNLATIATLLPNRRHRCGGIAACGRIATCSPICEARQVQQWKVSVNYFTFGRTDEVTGRAGNKIVPFPLSPHDARHRAARRRVQLFLHSSGFVRQSPALHGKLHGARHLHRILGGRDRCIHQHTIGAQLHRDRRVAGRAHAGVDDHRPLRDHLAEDAQIGRVLHAEPAADRRRQRHHCGRARVNQLARVDHIVVGVRQHDELLDLLTRNHGGI